MSRWITGVVTGCWLLLATGCAINTGTKPTLIHLDDAKGALIYYHDSGLYAQEVTSALTPASAFLLKHAPVAKQPAIVLDVDDTALSTWQYQRRLNFGTYGPALKAWRAEANAPAIEPVLTFFRLAREHHVAVFFITGRREADRDCTARNLLGAGYDGYEKLLMKPDDDQEPTGRFKTAARRELVAAGYTILVNVGDQDSDLSGGSAELAVKLPNYLYRVR